MDYYSISITSYIKSHLELQRENPPMSLEDIKETKRYGRTHGQSENSMPTTNKVCVGYKKLMFNVSILYRKSIKLFYQMLW